MSTSLPNGPTRRAGAIVRLALLCMFTMLCAASASAERISLAELNAGLAHAAADLDTDRAACNQLAGNARDVCRERALAKERLTRAELALARTGTRQSQDYLATVKLDTAFDIARTQCNDKTGDAHNLCTRQAQATRTQGQADLKPSQGTTGISGESQLGKAGKLTADKCDQMAADARAGCLAAGKEAPNARSAPKAGKT